ncbi:hypothetical protein T265_10463 [Opisthorchis viverrini]|uniref:Uncharacterized protein n=1 Tax=Opisthorchis viverrini TaxID=6198 RepID=A0A074Z2G8_OPIVI|nr:hypothetical protein T265_10463 [Opisthorchis viverrini]KER21153.1 hypothetical protein T265_10463 [Opisthorchis viverrini]
MFEDAHESINQPGQQNVLQVPQKTCVKRKFVEKNELFAVYYLCAFHVLLHLDPGNEIDFLKNVGTPLPEVAEPSPAACGSSDCVLVSWDEYRVSLVNFLDNGPV